MLVSFSTCYSRGTQHFTGTVSNEATSEMGYPAWPAGRTCFSFCFRDGMWLTQEPPRRFQTTWFPFSRFARFSQSEFPMSLEDERAASEQVNPSSKDVERFPSHSFALPIIQPFLSGLTEVFLHVRCIPHQ